MAPPWRAESAGARARVRQKLGELRADLEVGVTAPAAYLALGPCWRGHEDGEVRRAKSTATENAITAFLASGLVRTKTARAIIGADNAGIQLTGRPVTDWQLARARLPAPPGSPG
ncbi:MAG: hypothetical protein ACRDNZ_14380 [Streptosporangiaceae bacterium]